MLSEKQIQHFKTFGFLVRRNVLSADEVHTFRDEIDQRAKEATSFIPFEPDKIGQGGRQFSMMEASTPFTSSLAEDDRLAGAAEQVFGNIAWCSAIGHQFVGDSVWHYDGGSFDSPGMNNIIYTQPVRSDSGALRVVPGSHHHTFHDQVAAFDPMGPLWTRAAATPAQQKRALDEIESIPCCVCEAEPGDVVSFDLRIFHGSLGGGMDRRACTIAYHQVPHTPEEFELAILNSRGQLKTRDNSTDPWNPPNAEAWLANPKNNKRRSLWIKQLRKLSQMETEQRGVQAIVENGKWKMVPCQET